MKVVAGKAAILDSIDWGTPFLFRLRDTTFIGVKVFSSRTESSRVPAVAVIWPHHPNVAGQVGLLAGDTFGARPIVPIDDAVLVASTKIEDLRLDDAVTSASGSILLFENHKPLMPVRFIEEQTWFADLETGEVLERSPGRVVAQVAKWSLVREVLGEQQVIAEFAAN